ncbi:4-alpha-glucanotransferase family protein [Trichomonas vaginalis G3]|uniref:4-alpha-glucanotransferase n=1 Tax=Trichomonas vaginalis (strain ATCC PRA-98 / G3) TaxID=412133 RepID=A2FZT7_TRIV3|nr:heteropolysaccharide binding [Trichomonas vaginalis G3]EAX89578.1 4-alpha-glucanotransferase family protein [Trichomonas vaginalis G3]KAI5496094.1 heteropolysaccharide binding [Trichomonas vaginalis G3]|eukprot:XP_001302508.1 4-alpha-glucanotransferase family protein [Trichomonas vaginalis G3]
MESKLTTLKSIEGLVLRFHVRVNTVYGQSVHISGNLQEFGNWDHEKSIKMSFEHNYDYWTVNVQLPLSNETRELEYKYLLKNESRVDLWEPERNHKITLAPVAKPAVINIEDQFQWKDNVLDAFSRATFVRAINSRENPVAPEPLKFDNLKNDKIRVYFSANCPYVRAHQDVYISGSVPELGNWDAKKGVKLADGKFPIWSGYVDFEKTSFPFDYKYVIANKDGTFIWETDGNRHCPAPVSVSKYPLIDYVQEWFVCPNRDLFKGMGIYVPLFSLRTEESQGIGSYTDLKKCVDCCNKMGASLIQLLPINDTTDNGDWADSYPYRQVSCFALHPVYIDLLAITEKLPAAMKEEILAAKNKFEVLDELNYPEVFAFKMKMLKQIFKLEKDAFVKNHLDAFVTKNASWLKPYALFCLLRDEYKTTEFRKWPKYSTITHREIDAVCEQKKNELLEIYWIQYVADKQFKESYDYATKNHVALKGDLPIGVNINSVECWAFPELFRLHMCAGAPPDDFSSDGQNWGFPTYNWDAMEKDGFSWWRSRLSRMAELYHQLRVDHILGFFRIWEVPRETCVRGLMGHFFPSLPYSRDELNSLGLWDVERLTKPYVRWHLLWEKFHEKADYISHKYFNNKGWSASDDWYDFKPEYNTEKKVAEALDNDKTLNDGEREHIKVCLFQLLSNVILLEDPERQGMYHMRTEVIKEHVELHKEGPVVFISSSWNELDDGLKRKIKEEALKFFYERMTGIWVQKAAPKLNVLKNATNMLICGEDLGQITDGIIHAIDESAILSLHVQRMSKVPTDEFDDYHKFGYLSVACPSTHDTSSLRGWWEENKTVRESFWWNILQRRDWCPETLPANVQEDILKQNIWSNSMWAIFLLQDITSTFDELRLQTPEQERINIPSDPNHRWRYRYPFKLEELAANDKFNNHIMQIVRDAHRI